jgi:hypothetical protein
MLTALRRARYGYLALPILLLCAVGRNPTAMADVLFCSRSRVYRTVRASQVGTLGLRPDEEGRRYICSARLANSSRSWLRNLSSSGEGIFMLDKRASAASA